MPALDAPTMDFSGSANAPVYAEQALAAKSAYDTAKTTIAAKRGQLYNQAGFNVTNNSDGSIANFTVDGGNPVGQYQQLQRAEGRGLEAQHQNDMSRHIGGTGIAAQPMSNMRFGNDVTNTNFANSFQNANQGLVDAGTGAFGTYQQALLNLQLQSISDAQATQKFPGAPPKTPPPPPDVGNGGQGSTNALLDAATSGISAYDPAYVGTNAIKPQKVTPTNFYTDTSLSAQSQTAAALKTLVAASKKKNVSGYAQSSHANLH